MSYEKSSKIALGSLLKPVTSIDKQKCFYIAYEFQLYDAYLGHMEAASALASKDLYHDAWLTLNLAVECYFKFAFCLVREKLDSRKPYLKPTDSGPFDYCSPGGFLYFHPSSNKDSRNLQAKDLEHNVLGLWGFFDRFTDASNYPGFEKLRGDLPTQKDWIDRRYEGRIHSRYRPKYLLYKRNFSRVLRACFGSIK